MYWSQQEFKQALLQKNEEKIGAMLLLLAERVIRSYRAARFGVPYLDLQQECCLRAVKALKTFDLDRGTSVFSFLTRVMRITCLEVTQIDSRKACASIDDVSPHYLGVEQDDQRIWSTLIDLKKVFQDQPIILDYLERYREFKNLKQFLCQHLPSTKRRRIHDIYNIRIRDYVAM